MASHRCKRKRVRGDRVHVSPLLPRVDTSPETAKRLIAKVLRSGRGLWVLSPDARGCVRLPGIEEEENR